MTKKIDYSQFGCRKGFDPNNRFHLISIVKCQGRKYKISTVDLGMNYSFIDGIELYYETMIFKLNNNDEENNPFEYFQKRYSTEEEAKKGHNEIVKLFETKKVDELLNDRY